MSCRIMHGENAGYGIEVDFTDDVVSSTIIFYFERDNIRFSVSGTQNSATEKRSQKILELVAADDKITTQEMANKLGISRRAVAKAIAKMQSEGILRRVGPDKGGHWEIISTDR